MLLQGSRATPANAKSVGTAGNRWPVMESIAMAMLVAANEPKAV